MREHGGQDGVERKPAVGTVVTREVPRKDRQERGLEE